MATIQELKTQIENANSLGADNLADHGINLDETATTHDIASNIAKIPSLKYANTVAGLFEEAVFPENTELVIDMPNVDNLTNMFYHAKNITKITILGKDKLNFVKLDGFIRSYVNGSSLTEIDFTNFNLCIDTMDLAFAYNNNLKRISGEFDFSFFSGTSIGVGMLKSLEEIRIKANTISVNTSFNQCSVLSAESVQSIIDGLAAVETAKTLTLNSAIVLTDEQKATISDKGWTLVQ